MSVPRSDAPEPASATGVRARVAAPVLTAAWCAVAAATLLAAGDARVRADRPVPALLLVGLFAATQTFVLNIQLRREARSVFVSEIPTFLALMSLSPATFMAVRVASALIGSGVLRQQYRRPQKLLFNLALAAAESGVASATFGALGAPGGGVPQEWIAGAVAAAAASAFTAVAVGLVIELLEDTVRLRVLLRVGVTAAVQALPVAAVGIAVWAAWDDDVWAAVPLAVVTALLLAGYRAYAALEERHLALERLYRFGQVVSHSPGLDDVLASVLHQAREIMHSEQARLTFVPDSQGSTAVEVVLAGSGVLSRGEPFYLHDAAWLFDAVVTAQRPVRVSRSTRDPRQRAWLERCQLRDSIMVPLMGESGPIGVLAVDDRRGDARGFEASDVRVLETVANQAAVALRNGELLDRLRHESLHDPLTGLPNRTLFQREVQSRLDAPSSDGFAVGIVDIDSFKDVNDTLGHQEGDRLLCEIARRMTTAVDGDGLVARLGGDEFALLMPGCPTPAAAERRAAAILRAFDAAVLLGGIDVDVSGSLGIALAPRDGTTVGALLKRADVAMYDAKQSGRGLRVFDLALDTSSPAKLALVAELRHGIESGDIAVHVQPKVDAASGRLTGTEALARWSTPGRGVVSPAEFVPLAERSGLIRPLTRHVLDLAVAGCAAWQQAAPGVGVAVNISVRSLTDDGLVRLVDSTLRRHRLPPHLLTLEITESHIMADPEGTLALLHELRDRGVFLSVDDFGTGYSSLSYLRRLPVHEVKIDRSFVQHMVDEPDDAAIVRSIIELARALGLRVVAEGVEDRRTWVALHQAGVDEIQGWVVAAAMPQSEVATWARGRARGLQAV